MPPTFDESFDKALTDAQAGQSPKDQAAPAPNQEAETPTATTETKVEEKQPEATPPEKSSEPEDVLLPQEEIDKLSKDPDALRKALNRAFTQKTQALAEQRKALEPYSELIKGLQEDPQGTVTQLAERLGVKIAEAAKTQPEVTAQDATTDAVAELKATLPPDLEFLADTLAPAIQKAVEKTLGKSIEPIRQQTEALRNKVLVEEIDQNLEAFTAKHPDWKKFEPEMSRLGQRLQPTPDPVTGEAMSWSDYMETLYVIATKDVRVADATKKTIEKMQQSASKSDSSTQGGVPAAKVAKVAPKGLPFDKQFEQAWIDAQQGVIYE